MRKLHRGLRCPLLLSPYPAPLPSPGAHKVTHSVSEWWMRSWQCGSNSRHPGLSCHLFICLVLYLDVSCQHLSIKEVETPKHKSHLDNKYYIHKYSRFSPEVFLSEMVRWSCDNIFTCTIPPKKHFSCYFSASWCVFVWFHWQKFCKIHVTLTFFGKRPDFDETLAEAYVSVLRVQLLNNVRWGTDDGQRAASVTLHIINHVHKLYKDERSRREGGTWKRRERGGAKAKQEG